MRQRHCDRVTPSCASPIIWLLLIITQLIRMSSGSVFVNKLICRDFNPCSLLDDWEKFSYPYTKKEFGKWELILPAKHDGTPAVGHNTRLKVENGTPSCLFAPSVGVTLPRYGRRVCCNVRGRFPGMCGVLLTKRKPGASTTCHALSTLARGRLLYVHNLHSGGWIHPRSPADGLFFSSLKIRFFFFCLCQKKKEKKSYVVV